jgi:hypothetical protein
MSEWTAHQTADPERFVWRMLRHKARAPSAPGSEAGKTHVTICVKRIQLGISCIALLVQKKDVSPPGGQQPFLQHQADRRAHSFARACRAAEPTERQSRARTGIRRRGRLRQCADLLRHAGRSGEGDAVSSRLKASLGGSSARPRGTIGRADRRPRKIAIRPYYFGFPQFFGWNFLPVISFSSHSADHDDFAGTSTCEESAAASRCE